jgi:pilus assembly protein CpaE
MFEYVIVDAGCIVDETVDAALQLSSDILLVSSFHVPVVRGTRRLLDRMVSLGHPASKIKIIMNRYETKADGIMKHTETTLKHRFFAFLPENYELASRAVNTGDPLMTLAPNAELTQSYHRLAGALTEQSGNNKSSFISQYLKSFRAKLSKRPTTPIVAST